MGSVPTITPRDLLSTIQVLLRHHRGEWVGPERVWTWILEADPHLAEQVRDKVKSYKDPARNNEVWFVSSAFSYLEQHAGFRVSNTEDVPEMKGKAYWLIARAE